MTAVVLVSGLGACRTVPEPETISEASRHVDSRMFFPEGSERYQLSPLQAFVFPEPLDTPTPSFPPGFDATPLAPTTVCVSMAVTAEGTVGWAGAVDGPDCVPPGQAPQLLQATLEQVRQWRFFGARICTYPDLASRQRDANRSGCNGEGVTAQAIPVSLAYAFVYEVVAGKPQVRAQPSAKGG